MIRPAVCTEDLQQMLEESAGGVVTLQIVGDRFGEDLLPPRSTNG